MPQPNKIPLPFAASGDKNTIPESTETTGLASWRDGFPAITSVPFSEGGIAPKRADFNGIFNALSQAVMWMQQGGVYAYDVNTDYEAGNVVLDAGGLYIANAANGPSSAVVQPSSDTTGATWKPLRLDLATPTAAGYMSGADKTKLDGLISTDATPTAAGYMSAEDKIAVDSIPSLGTFNHMFFSQTSGTYIAPRTGWYRITLKGGGGGGGPSSRTSSSLSVGGGGGEGGRIIFYVSLQKNSTYPYIIGAGGAGASAESASRGSDGGQSSIVIDGVTYYATGGSGGSSGNNIASASGGTGGPASAFIIPGAPGIAGVPTTTLYNYYVGMPGGGNGGGRTYSTGVAGVYGGGGGGGSVTGGVGYEGGAGGNGYILVEYAG